jgi:ribose 5-phosphate isomerase B
MIIAIGSDHRGAEILPYIRPELEAKGCQVLVLGACDGKTCDYPDQAYPVARAVAEGQADFGILICGSGIGMSITANKISGVRAALVHDEIGAEMARRHNNANVLCLSADLLGPRVIERIVHIWLQADFEGGRHARRIDKITAIEQGTYAPDQGDGSGAVG